MLTTGTATVRIIPARAGFTSAVYTGSRVRSDHPRSRGVYRFGLGIGIEAEGSSPLARGLLAFLHRAGARGGIIPARAGFTPHSCSPYPTAQDHPRSRGVYYVRYLPAEVESGSSPLARGLPSGRSPMVCRCGIIPARAGFTPSDTESQTRRPDHPRSRGVYCGESLCCRLIGGSSPLARGLLYVSKSGSNLIRIIPARAGFTNRLDVAED